MKSHLERFVAAARDLGPALVPIDASVIRDDLLARDPDEVAAAFNVSREQAIAGLARIRREGD